MPSVILTGILARDAGGFFLRQDGGGICRLELHRVPVDQVEKHVVVSGVLCADGTLEADGVQLRN